MDFPQQLVVVVDVEFPVGEAHGRRTVAAAATLVKDEGSVLGAEAIDDFAGSFGDGYFWHDWVDLVFVETARPPRRPVGPDSSAERS